jgi:hypothetical protein
MPFSYPLCDTLRAASAPLSEARSQAHGKPRSPDRVWVIMRCSYRRHRVHPDLPWTPGKVYAVAVHLRRGDINNDRRRPVVPEDALLLAMETMRKAIMDAGENHGQAIEFHVFTQVLLRSLHLCTPGYDAKNQEASDARNAAACRGRETYTNSANATTPRCTSPPTRTLASPSASSRRTRYEVITMPSPCVLICTRRARCAGSVLPRAKIGLFLTWAKGRISWALGWIWKIVTPYYTLSNKPPNKSY